MLNENVYKNQVITESVLKEYQMLVGEFEKYAIQEDDGTYTRRIVFVDLTLPSALLPIFMSIPTFLILYKYLFLYHTQ